MKDEVKAVKPLLHPSSFHLHLFLFACSSVRVVCSVTLGMGASWSAPKGCGWPSSFVCEARWKRRGAPEVSDLPPESMRIQKRVSMKTLASIVNEPHIII